MTKKEIVRTISDEMALTQLQTKEIVQKTFDAIIETLVEDTKEKLLQGSEGPLGRIELRNFGVFEVKRRAPRRARNPRTGEEVPVPEKFVVTFKPGRDMEKRVKVLVQASEAGKKATRSKSPKAASSPSPVAQTLSATTTSGSGSVDS
ncbi:MAG: integration host factor subunit beta [Candidatus Nealsonbacteria bacterium]|nr:integration host factor subunit beta [Candidatus Nealsonbacteria bacterium]